MVDPTQENDSTPMPPPDAARAMPYPVESFGGMSPASSMFNPMLTVPFPFPVSAVVEVDAVRQEEALPEAFRASWPPVCYWYFRSGAVLPAFGTTWVFIGEDYSTEGSIENQLNAERLERFREFTGRVVTMTREATFEFGFESELDSFLRESLENNALAAKEWLNEIFIGHFEDTPVLVGLLRSLAHLDYDAIRPQGPTMAIAALSHKDAEVRECGIRAFENWESRESLKVLENVRCAEPWLQDYVDRVVLHLRETLANVAVG